MTRDQERSLWLGYATAGKLVASPDDVIARAQRNLDHLLAASRGSSRRWFERWQRLLAGPTDEILHILTSRSPMARELRQNSPFAGVLSDDERRQILDAHRSSRRTRNTPS